MNPRIRSASIAMTACLLLACSETKATEPTPEPAPDAAVDAGEVEVDAGEIEPAEPAFELLLGRDKLPVLQGASASVEVTVKRKNGFEGAVVIASSELPVGVEFEPVTVPADQEQAMLELRAQATAPHSLPTEVTFEGTSGALHAERHATVTVYGPPGSLDTSFAGGKVVVPVGNSEDYAQAMAVQADGKLVVVGQSSENGGDFALLRLTRDGALDASFGVGGKVLTAIGTGSDSALAVAVQSDGKIVVAGSSFVQGQGLDFALARYSAEGELDTTFGVGGKVTTTFTADSDTAYAVVLQADGKIVVGGEANRGTAATGVDFALARYLSNGSLDPSFGDNGKVMTSLVSSNGRDSIYALALQELEGETRILAVGGEGDFAVARYGAAGDLDPDFGNAGKLTGILGSSIGAARAVQLDAEGRILIAGHHSNDFALVRFSADGELDAAFGTEGKVVTAVSATNWDAAQGLAVQADGKILLGGWVYEGNSSSGNFALVRYEDAGVLDATFGSDGIAITELAAPTKRDEARALVLQSDARVPTVRAVLAGYANGSNADFAVTRSWL